MHSWPTQIIALWQNFTRHLEAATDVSFIGLRHGQFTDGYMRSAGEQDNLIIPFTAGSYLWNQMEP